VGWREENINEILGPCWMNMARATEVRLWQQENHWSAKP